MTAKAVSAHSAGNASLGRRIFARWQLYLLLLLPIAWLITFAYIPMGGLVLAFKTYKPNLGVWGSPWVGMKNFNVFLSSYKFSWFCAIPRPFLSMPCLSASPFPLSLPSCSIRCLDAGIKRSFRP